MVGEDLLDRLMLAGKPVGLGLVVYAAARLFMFLCTFVAARMDARQARLDAQEERLTKSLGDRLNHLEEQVARIPVLEEVVNILVAEVRAHDPNNPKLAIVGKILRSRFQPSAAPGFDDLIGKLDRID